MRFTLELASTCPGQRVKFRAAIVLARPPIGFDPTAMLQFVQRWVKRAIADAQHVIGHLIQPAADGPPVHGLVCQDLQKQKVQGALNEIARPTHGYRVETMLSRSVSKWYLLVQLPHSRSGQTAAQIKAIPHTFGLRLTLMEVL